METPPSSPSKTAARCPHFGLCGGCSLQDLPYPEQLERKRSGLESLLRPYWPEAIEIHASPEPWYYRNKMEFGFGRLGHRVPPEGKPYEYVLDGTVLGFKKKGRWDQTLDIQECFLMSEEVPALLAAVRRWVEQEKLEGYDAKSERGFLRYLLVREGKGTGQRLVMAITAPGAFPGASFTAAVRAVYPATTVLRGVAASVSDVARSGESEVLFGPGTITEQIDVGRKLRFRISPFSFFQTNTKGTEILYKLVREFAPPPVHREGAGGRAGSIILDLYGGAGGIAFTLSDLADKVISVENNAAATEDGRHNAGLNGITNVGFVTAAVEAFLTGAAVSPSPYPLPKGEGVVILDPPRAGIHPKALKALMTLLPKRIVYVSCNPKMLAADLKTLTLSYKVARLEAVDLFPHTEHVEAVALLELV